MLRMETETGWWLITHPDHAGLAGAFAAAWGNVRFQKPEPRARVLHAISRHDDGWAARDAHPAITRQGKPSAFSTELVDKYSAFEEIDLPDYLAVRDRAVRIIAANDPYAGLLVSMHTYNLLTERADRTTIAPDELMFLDAFLNGQQAYQKELRASIEADDTLAATAKSDESIRDHFRLLQACDNLSLLSCVAYSSAAHLLHPLRLQNGSTSEVRVCPIAPRHFRLSPWPFAENELHFSFPARHVQGKIFGSSAELETAFAAAALQSLSVTLSE